MKYTIDRSDESLPGSKGRKGANSDAWIVFGSAQECEVMGPCAILLIEGETHDGGLSQVNAIMSTNYASFDQLIAILDWLRSQRPDSAYSRFCLFRIAFANPQVLGRTFGAPDAMHRLNRFGTMLASTVRGTDLVARDLSVFWILTPECNSDIVSGRLREIVVKVEEFELDVVQCSVGAHVFPLEHAKESNTRALLERLAKLPAAYKFEPAQNSGVS